MSYDSVETSVDGGRPRTFFEFVYGEGRGDAYRFVGSTEQLITGTLAPVIAMGKPWISRAMKHGRITSAGSLDKSDLEVTTSKDNEVAKMFRIAPPSRPLQLNIYRDHEDDGGYVRIWTGRVLVCSIKDSAEAVLSCEPTSTSLRRQGLRRNYQYGCPHDLYGRACGLSREANEALGTVTLVTNPIRLVFTRGRRSIILTPEQAIGGVLTVTLDDGRTLQRSVINAVQKVDGIELELMSVMPELKVGLSATLARGCKHNWEACKTFDNLPNYGGCINIPSKNPFTGNSF